MEASIETLAYPLATRRPTKEADVTASYEHSAVGGPNAVVTSDPRATEAAVGVLKRGGTAVDALIAAAAVQCVTGQGALSLTGVWISDAYDAATGTTMTVSSKIGPAEAEDYDYAMESVEAYSGRAMPVPGWPAGAHAAWEQGGRLPWAQLFEAAISLAEDGYPLDPYTYFLVRMGPLSGRTAEGRALFMSDGRYLDVGDVYCQPALARTLRALADGGPTAFYEGEFAQEYVKVAQEWGGKITLADLARWRERPEVRPSALLGDYYGCQIVTEGGLLVYALHLFQAAGLDTLDEAEAVYAQVRVLEEVFNSTSVYSAETHDQFIDRSFAESRIDDVLNGPLRGSSFTQFFSNTATLAARDADGNIAWLVHSLNTPNVFGTGIVVGGQFVVRAISKTHARIGDLLAPGLFSKVALCREGKPCAIAASPGYSCVHAPLQALAAHVPRGLDALAANVAPRFALPSPATVNLQPFESHYPSQVFKLLDKRGVPYMECAPSLGNVMTMVIDGEHTHVASDVRARAAATVF
jgi:gamma-glutamyltranspeptidase / glutathione hydrolase